MPSTALIMNKQEFEVKERSIAIAEPGKSASEAQLEPSIENKSRYVSSRQSNNKMTVYVKKANAKI